MKTFRIKQNFGKGSLGFVYFDIEDSDIEIIRKKAYDTQIEDYQSRTPGWFGNRPKESPTIRIEEYCTETRKPLKNGIKFSFKWR